jgi:hypothetical protein
MEKLPGPDQRLVGEGYLVQKGAEFVGSRVHVDWDWVGVALILFLYAWVVANRRAKMIRGEIPRPPF